MEGIHGVDTSWLHHHKAHGQRPSLSSLPAEKQHSPSNPLSDPEKQQQQQQSSQTETTSANSFTNGANGTNGFPEIKAEESASQTSNLPSHDERKIDEKHAISQGGTGSASGTTAFPSFSPQTSSTKEKTRSPSPALSRKSSWISSLSSKFSPSKHHEQKEQQRHAEQQQGIAAAGKASPSPRHEKTDPMSNTAKDNKPSAPTVLTPARPTGFLSSALRRFSSSSGSAMAKSVPNGGICPRRVLNIDPHRERCEIPDLQPGKMKRVAFCVDVEIAATPKYRDDSPEDPTITAAQQRKRANSGSEKKTKAKTKERSEGEALKNPDVMLEKKEGSATTTATETVAATTVEARQRSSSGPSSRNGDMFEIPDVDEKAPKTPNPAQPAARQPSPPKKPQQTTTSPLTSPAHHSFGPSAMFEVDDFDEVDEQKLKVPQRRGSAGGSPHHDFGRHGMFEIPSEDESTEPEPLLTPKQRRRSEGSNSSVDRPGSARALAAQIGTGPLGHVPTQHLMFEIPDEDADDDAADFKDAMPEAAKSEKPVPASSNATASSESTPKADDEAGTIKATPDDSSVQPATTTDGQPHVTDPPPTDPPQTTRKKEKKKKSEEERKERKEKKKQAAIANGTIPVELNGDDTSENTSSGPQPSNKPKTQSRPTTDPLRIYRRCCSLRETTPLPRIIDQLSSTAACDPLNPAVVLCIDLSGQTIPMQDLVTLGDWLGVVPVQKLLLENCGLTDEGVRIVLAGLLAVKTSEQARHNKHLAKKGIDKSKGKKERQGVIVKLSLKNNRLVGRQGWMHIAYFLNMSRSLKAIDLSMIPFPKQPSLDRPHIPPPIATNESQLHQQQPSSVSPQALVTSHESPNLDPFDVFAKCVAERAGGDMLEEVVMGECELSGERIEKLIDAVIACKCSRFGLAHNNLDQRGFQAVAKYIRSGNCVGLDLGGNDLSVPENQKIITDALESPENRMMFALSLAAANLSPTDLKTILPILTKLPEFRFIDFSHNHKLFEETPNALPILGRYLPRIRNLKRFHLNDVSMQSEHAIALAEICPEIPSLAHVSILDNPALTALANAKEEASQEEACALYASLMAATRVSKTIVCIDIDVPSKDNSEVVKALAKQVVAYSLRNMERGEAYKSAAALIAEPHGGEQAVTVPDVLLHLVGHVDNLGEYHDDDPPAPDQDYLVGGTGVVKALSVVLGNRSSKDYRRLSRDFTPNQSGTPSGSNTPKLGETAFSKGKAKDMSRNLLESARKIRHRLQPALVRARAEDLTEDSENYRRLFYLDNTLERMILRFEEEYPECRPVRPRSMLSSPASPSSPATSFPSSLASAFNSAGEDAQTLLDDDGAVASGDEDNTLSSSLRRSRHGSDVSLASRNLMHEEGRMHKFGQRMRREILPPVHHVDHHWGTSGDGAEPLHLNELRRQLEQLDSEEIKKAVEAKGVDQALRDMNATVAALKALEKEGGGVWEKCKSAGMCTTMDGVDGSKERANGESKTAGDAPIAGKSDAVTAEEEDDSGLEMAA